ncbi:MAG TPA: shikimate dehydrogenase [Pyrinomonadaceae bacterium]
MNDGKICVSICAKTADEFLENIKRAAEFADVIELRFDCLDEAVKPESLWSDLEKFGQIFKGKLLATFRPTEQGGKRKLKSAERREFWSRSAVDEFVDWGDFESDFSAAARHAYFRATLNRIIWSFHDFKGVPANLDDIFSQLAALTEYPHHPDKNPDVVKIAVRADDITDTIAVWKLLQKAKLENKKIIPIAMGEAGKWTRILGLAHGAFMTYAALEAGNETAPGQISARDLIEVYRAGELNDETEVYGIIGANTSYSMSPYIHNTAFKLHGLNSVFIPLQIKNLDEFMRRMVKPETREIHLNFKGFAVTIPHKQNIIKHLDSVDETARKIGAVNTVKIEDGKLSGGNTDAQGFIEPLQNTFGDLKNAQVAVFGAGGASRAVCCALKKAGADVTVFARNLEKAEPLKADFDVRIQALSPAKNYNDFDVLVNATPLGTKGELENETPAVAAQIESVKLVYDLIYNPFETKLIKEAQKVFVPTLGGLSMLIAQAAAQQKIWTSLDAPTKEMSAAALQRLAAK